MSVRVYCDTPLRPEIPDHCGDYAGSLKAQSAWWTLNGPTGTYHFCSIGCLHDWTVRAHRDGTGLSTHGR